MAALLILLVILNKPSDVIAEEVATVDTDEFSGDLFDGVHKPVSEKEIVYIDRHPVGVVTDRTVGRDYGVGIVLDDDPDVVVIRDDVAVVSNPDHVVLRDRDHGIIVDDRDVVGGGIGHIGGPDVVGHRGSTVRGDRGIDINDGHGRVVDDNDIGIVDVAALNRAIRERDEVDIDDEFGVDGDELGNLTLAKDKNGDFDIEPERPIGDGVGKDGYGLDKGDLYAYNTPSLGVGAGIGAPAIGAGVGAAGLGAGIGEAVLNEKTVPALGGIGTSPALPANGLPGTAIPTDGVGGLTSGAGAGGAAGLVTGTVTEKLGLGIGVGKGKGCETHGAGCDGHHGHGGEHNYDHLPPNGALHIMMHVDGSGSILSTRKQLEIMKDSLLKEALLPYYNNDEQLYNRRVTIVDGNGERTLQFFSDAAKKDNVLALVFQDEAQPAYHMPNFNKSPEDHYLKDLGQLKSKLRDHNGLYRGVMLQVDRGRTFAKSFKEFVENSWQGAGYLSEHNLKKYYWEENKHHIDNKDGIVFSDVYHVKDEGDPQYYLDLIFEASKRIGIDLDIYGAGLTDGKYKKD
ncbi:hypothetical protein CMO96_03785 [Candidatus Woesebacteria bacterium]|nr:hypothetical protein [Candidatus Woesebacteria bacterium]